MDRKQIEHKLEQAQKDMMGIKDNILWLKSQLETEPVLRRHGDYGFYADAKTFPILITTKPGYTEPLIINHKDKTLCEVEIQNTDMITFGNIFSDLEAMTEDIEEIDTKDMRIKLCDGSIEFYIKGGMIANIFDVDTLQQIHRRLGALIYKLKQA